MVHNKQKRIEKLSPYSNMSQKIALKEVQSQSNHFLSIFSGYYCIANCNGKQSTINGQWSWSVLLITYYVLQVTCSGSYIPCHTFYLQHRNRVGKRALALHYWYKEHWDCTPEQVVLMSLSAQAVNSWRSSSEHILIVI